MKKIIFLLFLLLFSICMVSGKVQNTFIEKIDLKLNDGEVGLVFLPIDNSSYLLIRTETESILLHTSGPDKGAEKVLKKLGQKEVNYSINTNFKANECITLKDTFETTHIRINKIDENYLLELDGHTFFVYNKGNFIPSSYVYFLNTVSIPEAEIKLAFYKDNIGEDFEKELTDHWIDSYKIKSNEFTIVKFSDQSYNVIRIPEYYF